MNFKLYLISFQIFLRLHLVFFWICVSAHDFEWYLTTLDVVRSDGLKPVLSTIARYEIFSSTNRSIICFSSSVKLFLLLRSNFQFFLFDERSTKWQRLQFKHLYRWTQYAVNHHKNHMAKLTSFAMVFMIFCSTICVFTFHDIYPWSNQFKVWLFYRIQQ